MIEKKIIHQKNKYAPIEVFITDNRDKMMNEIGKHRKLHTKQTNKLYTIFSDIWRGKNT